ncbi:arsenite methyltransferase-like [Haliotis rubra]|uniref:arsenite methyltransferase-like n=1 Tax=Haliotis rubra TaxID=36100 RepID=UPI001EE5884A|nr:arsenite methyltransferase-like [Haliotis rubra]XP_046576868.1 arsenite methyltransferase-like [Haliotis rubra]XP_046576869.1 arsenite methyltransferase-like [Haliotis rubra]XP_046576870.1 arsenite methyltransferase-like [Haliotis rubra]
MGDSTNIIESVKEYYGKTLQNTNDLKTGACMTPSKQMTKPMKAALSAVHDEVHSRYYGCGLVIPEKVEGMRVLDLGSGSGRDCYALSKLVGEEGSVVGLDMTDEQLEVAWKYVDYHTQKFGYSKPNVEFVKGYIEKITEAGIKENSIDVIISNCVINLSPDKKGVLREAYKVLKEGGELYFSDVYCDRDLPDSARKHKVLWGECISGALWWEDLYTLAKEVGFSQPRLVTATPVPVEREDFKQVLGDARFVSVTYRLFKLPSAMQPARQVIYNGEITGYEGELKFDYQQTFKNGDAVSVGEEMSTILSVSRFKEEFDFQPAASGSSGSAPAVQVKIDPFVYMAQLDSKGELPASACCVSSAKKCC